MLGAFSELDDAAAIAFCWAAFGEGGVLLHGFAFGGFALAAFLAVVGFAVESLSDRCGAADIGDSEDFDVEFAGLVPYAEHVAGMNIARGLGFDFV